MSKRPNTANGVMSRLRRPTDRLRDLPIWSKLGLIMLVPTLATIGVGVTGLVDHIDEAGNAERARTLAVLAESSGALADGLQNERAFGVMAATNAARANVRSAALASYNGEHTKVDQAKLVYSQQKTGLEDIPSNINSLLLRLDRNLEDLPARRSQIANGKMSASDISATYNTLVHDLLSLRDSSAQLANDPTLGDHIRTVAAVARVKEAISTQRYLGHVILQENKVSVLTQADFLTAQADFGLSGTTVNTVGTPVEQREFNQVENEPAGQAAVNLISQIAKNTAGNQNGVPFTTDEWEKALSGSLALYRGVELKMDANVVDDATALRDTTNRRVFIETSALLAMLLLSMLFAWLVARSMARSLRELRQGALSVAQFGLPHAVERLRDPALAGSLTPAQVADQIAEPLPVRSRDEFGQVTEAFNAVHLEAVRTAAEQAALRSSVSTMFVNLARRSQILVDRLIGHLDRLERGEEDPDRLAELFQLDHLATRMRRNDENLLVLAGADSTRVQREPAALIDVLRAAQSEVEHYTRVEFGMIDRDIEVAAHAVNDMVHLVAELFDNATAFSPPNSTVIVEARRLGDGALLSVEDRGIGISREQLHDLNDRLANPPMVDVAVSRMMGLVVVARLANRHEVKVELRPADTERGTVAEVMLPVPVLILGGSGRPPGFDDNVGDNRPGPGGGFSEPLALEGAARGGQPTGRAFDPNPPMPSGGMLGTNGPGSHGSGANGRSAPAWSDLTGAPAANGSGANGFGGAVNGSGSNGFGGAINGGGLNGGGLNGSANGHAGPTNGFYGPRSNEMIPPLPPGPAPISPGPQGLAGPDGLPQRRTEAPVREDSNGFGPSIPRQLPSHPDGRGPSGPPVSAPPVSGSPFPEPSAFTESPAVVPASPAPPVWPPVAPERESAAPHVPENLAAALDMTAEIPRFRPERTDQRPDVERPANPQVAAIPTSGVPTSGAPSSGAPASPEAQRAAAAAKAAHEAATAQAAEAQATAAAQIAAAQAARQRDPDGQYADETMELPIFRELESAWFMTARPAEVARPINGDDMVTAQRIPTGEPVRSVPQQASSPESIDLDPATVGAGVANGAGTGAGATAGSGPWQTAADEGWQAAQAASEMPVETTTNAGLPKRKPMAQLVPGGVERAGSSVQRRTPEGVRGLLSAYHRGVQRGRVKEETTNPEATSGGQQSSQAGKEHEA